MKKESENKFVYVQQRSTVCNTLCVVCNKCDIYFLDILYSRNK
jgi:hypothetical protein